MVVVTRVLSIRGTGGRFFAGLTFGTSVSNSRLRRIFPAALLCGDLGDPSLAFRVPLAGGGADSVSEGGGANSGWAGARAHLAGNDPWELIGIEEWRRLRTRTEWADALGKPLPEPAVKSPRLAARSGGPYGSEEFVRSLEDKTGRCPEKEPMRNVRFRAGVE